MSRRELPGAPAFGRKQCGEVAAPAWEVSKAVDSSVGEFCRHQTDVKAMRLEGVTVGWMTLLPMLPWHTEGSASLLELLLLLSHPHAGETAAAVGTWGPFFWLERDRSRESWKLSPCHFHS